MLLDVLLAVRVATRFAMYKEISVIVDCKNASEPSANQVSADILLSSFDCVIFDREAVYASSEFTTGRRFYQLCRELKVSTGEELKRALGTSYSGALLLPNKDEGVTFARKLRGLGLALVISPNPLIVYGWGQDEYLGLWERVILGKCHAVYFNDGWEFSNGCTYEYLVSVRQGLPVFDCDGRPLPLQKACDRICSAIAQLESEGFSVPKLRNVLSQLA